MSKVFSFLVLFGISFSGICQFGFEYDPNLPVRSGGVELTNPWGGGLNYSQISDFDYDFDGDLDLFIFDRSTNNIRVLTQEDPTGTPYYRLAYDAKSKFPAEMRYRAIMIDFDMDGRKDLFSYGIGGLKVHRNVGDVGNGIQWELVTNLIYSEYENGQSHLFVSSSDIPAIVDVDFDGDIDILTFDPGGSHVEYHQNQSMELYGIPDSLIFELRNKCWGKFEEDFNTSAITLNAPCSGGNIGNPIKFLKHAGSTILALDIDNSGVMDLVLGDISFPNMNLLINGGTAPNTDSPMVTADNAFPSNTTPVNMQIFPAAFFVDVDFDGVKDIVVSPNARNVSLNRQSIHFYKNLGTNDLPNFVFSTPEFLQEEMIEVGTGSIPILTDINEDGLEDLIVGNLFRYKPILDKESTIAYYQNTGTANNPEFTYVDNDYLNLSTQNYGLRSVPTFGDLDGDGDKDMLLGIENGSIVYYENQSSGSGSVFATGIPNFQDNLGQVINVGNFSFPTLFDLDDDGLIDLIIGKKNGELAYYRNIGTTTNASFELQDSDLGSIHISGFATPDAYAAPHFYRSNDTTHLFIGDVDGDLYYFNDIDDNLGVSDTFNLVTDALSGINVQGYSSFATGDLNNNGFVELYAGQDLGGIFRFESDPTSDVGLTEVDLFELAVYPNPTNSTLSIQAETDLESIRILSIDGSEVFNADAQGKMIQLDLSSIQSGPYIVLVTANNGVTQVRRIIKN